MQGQSYTSPRRWYHSHMLGCSIAFERSLTISIAEVPCRLEPNLQRQGYTICPFAWGRKDDCPADELAILNLVPERPALSACTLPQ